MNRNRMLAGVLSGLVALIVSGQSPAKPPDLPLDLEVKCCERGFDSDHFAPPTDDEVSSLSEEECCPCLDTCCAGVCHWLCQALENVCCQVCSQAEPEQLNVIPAEVQRPRRKVRQDRRAESRLQPAGDTATRGRAEEQQQVPSDDSDLDDLLNKSRILRQHSQEPPSCPRSQDESRHEDLARQLYRIAERCRRRGDHAMARSCYDEVQRMAPNTALARHAYERLELCSQFASAVEEAEVDSSMPNPDRASRPILSLSAPINIELEFSCNGASLTLCGITLEIRPSSRHSPFAVKHPSLDD